MTRLQPESRQIMKTLELTLAICACIALASGSASAQLASNQTNGFGNNQLVTFTYLQNFDCVDQPKLDLDFNGTLAQSDPNEMQTPICPCRCTLSARPVLRQRQYLCQHQTTITSSITVA